MDIDIGGFTFSELLKFFRKQAGLTQKGLSEATGYSEGYISKLERGDRPPPLATTKLFAQALSLDSEHEHLLLRAATTYQNHLRPSQEDWGEAPSSRELYGRTRELQALEQWIITEQKSIVAVLGLGGIGKTALVAQASEQMKGRFEFVYWRSLYNAPSVQSIIQSCLLFFSEQQQGVLPQEVDQQLVVLLNFLRNHRCLLILDNVDAVMEDRVYQEGYEGYGTLIRRIGEAQHQSCLLLTSRIKPTEMAFLSGGQRSHGELLYVSGLDATAGQKLLKEKGIGGNYEDCAGLVRLYSGNPLSLQIIADSLREVFGGDISRFLHHIEEEEETAVFGDLSLLLRQQLLPLSENERNVLYWLAIEREAVTFEVLRKNMIAVPMARGVLLDALDSLLRRSLIEHRGDAAFGLQPVIMEYLTNEFVACICKEIEEASPRLLASHVLIKAQSKDYIHETQRRLILSPIAAQLLVHMERTTVELQCQALLVRLRQTTSRSNYLAGNLLNLLIHMGYDLRDYDFSRLAVWQADLRSVSLPATKFDYADFTGSVFAYPFDAIIALALHPSGKIATAATNNQVLVWSVEGIPLFACFHQDWIWSVAFSPNGSLLVSGCDDHMIRLWDAEKGCLLRTLQGHTDWVRALTFSPDGNLLASGSSDQTIRFWDPLTGKPLHMLHHQHGTVWSVVFSPDGKLLASSHSDQTIRLWDVPSGRLLHTLQEQSSWPIPLAFHPDGNLLASGSSDQTIRLWDLHTHRICNTFHGHTGWVMCVAFSPDGALLASGSNDQTIRLWEVESGLLLKRLYGHDRRVWEVAFSSDGKSLISGSDDQTLRFWEIKSGRLLKTMHGQSGATVAVAWSPDGHLLASGCDEPGIKLWTPEIREPLSILVGHLRGIWSVAFSPAGNLLASGGDDHTIRLWDLHTRQILRIWEHRGYVWSVAFSPDGNLLASSGDDHMIRVWNVNTGQEFRTFPGQSCWVWSVVFSSDGKLLASGSDEYTIQLWDVESGQLFSTLQGHTDNVRSLAFSPDGNLLASSGSDQAIRLWEVKSGQLLSILRGHSHVIRSVAFHPDGSLLASGSADQTIQLWEVRSGQLLSTLRGHTHHVWSVVFSPDGKELASGSHDGTIRIWKVSTGECLKVLVDRPYEQMNITFATGLTAYQKETLRQLGAVGN